MSVEKGLTNAPRVVREVEGDFTAEVRTSGDFPTDNHSLSEGRWAFYGSGLVIWESEKNYIRFERARMNIPKSGWRCYPNWELRQDGAMTRGWLWEDGTLDATQPAHLRITRKGQEVTGEVSQDGKEWRKLPKLDVKFGRTVRVGIAALQNTAAGYKPVFDGLTITSAGKR
jgi:regulation of enolase protein 1 (concanavalin A-like superfamily)